MTWHKLRLHQHWPGFTPPNGWHLTLEGLCYNPNNVGGKITLHPRLGYFPHAGNRP